MQALVAISFDVILILVAGALWVIGRLAESAKQFRSSTRRALERQQRRERVELEPPARPTPYQPVEPTESIGPKPPPPPRRPPRRRSRPPPPVAQHAGRVVADSPRISPRAAAWPSPGRLRGDPGKLREAIVWREILGPPLALRNRRRRW